ncbi:MAG: hypothetical protein HY896_03170 [Deltaproteobacteria bacterium]|nr:hypothetical protein [Deltaproteobacteria bacterium]
MGIDDPRQGELLEKLVEGVDGALGTVGEIDKRLVACSKLLRVGDDADTFTALSSCISNLGDLFDLVREIRNGTSVLKTRSVPADAFASWEKSVDLFREMLTAFEGKDWITLADLIQYEISPLLAEGEKDLTRVRELLAAA